jgi:phospholipase C
MNRRASAFTFAALGIVSWACGKAQPTTIIPDEWQPFDHVIIVVLENRNYDKVIANPDLPYLNSLADRYALAPQFHANVHPSVGNYLMMTVGDTITNNGSFEGSITQDNVIRQLAGAGKTWKSYAEDLPATGYLGGDHQLYARRHNPFVWFADVKSRAAEQMNIVPFAEFANDLASGRVPHYSFLVPNLCNDGHECSDTVVDTWLRTNIDPILHTSLFENSVLIVTYDEAERGSQHGGGRIFWLAVSPRAKAGYRSTTVYQFQSLLRLSLEALGVNSLPNRANGAPTMWEFFSR